jgi:8-oxo-dGTP diphosphatase
VAGAGPAVAIVVRAPGASTAEQTRYVLMALEAARAAEAAVVVHARADLARAVGAQGVQLRRDDPAPADARRVLQHGWIGVSIHEPAAARAAAAEGADFLVAGNLYESPTHPGRPGRGLAWLREICAAGLPVFTIGGMTPERVALAREAGAWGAAAVSFVWGAAHPDRAALDLIAPWTPRA